MKISTIIASSKDKREKNSLLKGTTLQKSTELDVRIDVQTYNSQLKQSYPDGSCTDEELQEDDHVEELVGVFGKSAKHLLGLSRGKLRRYFKIPLWCLTQSRSLLSKFGPSARCLKSSHKMSS
jgi:hypothetical protein